MTFVISRIGLAVNETAKKVCSMLKKFSFSRNKASRGASARPYYNTGPSAFPGATLPIHDYPNIFPNTTCYCRECVYRLQMPNGRPDYNRAQVSLRPPPPPPVIIIGPPTPPSTMRPVQRNKDRDLARDSARPKPSPPGVIVIPPTPPSTVGLSQCTDDLDFLTDDELIAQMEELCVQISRLSGLSSGVVQEGPVTERLEALSVAKPVMVTFAQPQPMLSSLMVQVYDGSLSPYSSEPKREEPYATSPGWMLEVPPIEICGDEDDDDDDSSETVTLRRLASIKRAGEVRG